MKKPAFFLESGLTSYFEYKKTVLYLVQDPGWQPSEQ
jgi:hypothetical protein